MSNNKKDLAAVSDSLGMDEGYVLICKTDPIHKGVWSDPAEFVWAIGEYGRKIILVGFLSDNFTPEQIAKVFCHGKFHKELSVQHDQLFICNNHDIVNAQKYMNEKGNVEFQQKFNEQNRKDWEQVPEQKLEVTMWMLELQKALYTPLLGFLVDALWDIHDELEFLILQIDNFPIPVVLVVAVLIAYAVENFILGR